MYNSTSTARFYRTGDNKPSEELREVAKIDALKRIAAALEVIADALRQSRKAD